MAAEKSRIGIAVALGAAVVACAIALPMATGVPADQVGRLGVPVPKADCGPGSHPETDLQGRVPKDDWATGRNQQGYDCNLELVHHRGTSGGFKVQRYTDSQGNVCAFYDSTRMIGIDVVQNLLNGTGLGVVVLDMNDPANPVKTANLITPAMLTPHESLLVNQERGLLVAEMGTLATAPGVMDVYDVKTDCRHPKLLSSTTAGYFGHESGLTVDGKTWWVGGAVGMNLSAVDLTDPRNPKRIFNESGHLFHGLRLSDDGNTLYVADLGTFNSNSVLDNPGLRIYDVSEVQSRQPDPEIRLIGQLTWDDVSIPQVAEPFTRDGHDYLLEVDEFSDLMGDGWTFPINQGPVGAARIINVDDPANPFVVSDLRLEVHQMEHREETLQDRGASTVIGGYAGHYCSVPTREEPTLVGCSMIGSGLRIFDISDLTAPREVAYWNHPSSLGASALSQPAWDIERNSVWYTDGTGGFWALRLTNGVRIQREGLACRRDGAPVDDADADGLTDEVETYGVRVRQDVYRQPGAEPRRTTIGRVVTDPCRRDTDGDGLSDRREVTGIRIDERIVRSRRNGGAYHLGLRRSDPTNVDTDGDGLTDRQEVTGSANRRHDRHRTDPARADTDYGGVADGREVKVKHTDPARV